MLVARLFALAALGFFSFSTAAVIRLAFDESGPADSQSSSAWITRGLAAEHAGNFSEAELALLQAARADRQYLPAWTLASFYFRQHRPQSFWPWAARAAALNYDDLRPLLKLADLIEPDPGVSLDRLSGTPQTEHAYLDFLIGEDRLEAARKVARRMLARHDPREAPRLADLVDRAIRAGHSDAAQEIWNGLGRFPRLDVASGAVLTNGDLRTAPSGEGFDWRLPAVEGLTAEWRPSQLDFAFGGAEPEACILLEQAVPLDANRYRLRFEYSTPGMPSLAGIHWALEGKESPVLDSSSVWRTGEWIFQSQKPGVAHLTLVYRRELGTTRAEGHLEIRNVRVEIL
jgi:hypothetical protein